MFERTRRLVGRMRERPGYSAVIAVALAEAAMNGTFGWSQGATYYVGPWIMAGALVANEAVKVTTAETLAEAIDAHAKGRAVLAACVLAAVTTISLASHIGFIGLSRGDAAAGREQSADAAKSVQQRLATALEERRKLGTVRPPRQIEADIEKACPGQGSKAPKSGRCIRLEGELAGASEAKSLDGRIAELEGLRLTGGKVGVADPQAYVLGWFWSADEEKRKITIAIMLAIMMEATTSLGFVLFGRGGREVMDLETLISQGALSHPGADQILPFRAAVLEPARGESVTIADAFQAYELWAKRESKPALNRPTFLRLIVALGVVEREGRLVGVRLKPVFLLTMAGGG